MKKKTILLYHPKTLHEKVYRFFYIPYSLLSVASCLDFSKYQVIIIDANLKEPSLTEIETIVRHHNILCVGISSMIGHQIRGGINFANVIRSINKKIPIVWGGPLCGVLPELSIEHPTVDIVVENQGQITFKELVDCLAMGDSISKVKGIFFKENNLVHKTAPREFIDWNSLPSFQESYGLISPSDYLRDDEHINTRTINYHSSQGCPFSCGFCSEVALWKRRWGGFEADKILSDVHFLVKNYNANGIKFYDAEFFINRKRVVEFAQKMLSAGINVKWAAAVHPKNFSKLSDQEVSMLQKSGLSRLLMGAESSIQEELDLIGKGTTPDLIKQVAKRCRDFGIIGCFSFVTGYPGFPLNHIESTVEFAGQLRAIDSNHECKVHLYGPYPGTPLYTRAIQHGFTPPASLEEWSHHDYYEVTTPWVPTQAQHLLRSFNEENYIYMNQTTSTSINPV